MNEEAMARVGPQRYRGKKNEYRLDALISQIYFWNKTLLVSDSSSVQDQHGLILLASCQQTCMTYTIAVCTVKNS